MILQLISRYFLPSFYLGRMGNCRGTCLSGLQRPYIRKAVERQPR
nr:MAG TPA: TraM-like-terminal domain of transfer protein TraM [Caudoviricetes sp.]